jgi:hypothetical protein
MLVKKGHGVRFDLETGRKVAARGGMLHDPEGASWPRCSVLVGPFSHGGKTDERLSSSARAYFGRGYAASRGSVELPPRAMTAWKEVGPVKTIWYTRTGEVMGGERFFHHFKRGLLSRRLPVLYRHGRFFRLELGAGCTLNHRGYIRP